MAADGADVAESQNACGPYQATFLWNNIIESFRSLMPTGRRRHLLRSYDNCFVAVDAVNFLHRFLQQQPKFGLRVTRLQTVRLLEKFHINRVFEDVRGIKYDGEPFIDSSSRLYRFCQQVNENYLQQRGTFVTEHDTFVRTSLKRSESYQISTPNQPLSATTGSSRSRSLSHIGTNHCQSMEQASCSQRTDFERLKPLKPSDRSPALSSRPGKSNKFSGTSQFATSTPERRILLGKYPNFIFPLDLDGNVFYSSQPRDLVQKQSCQSTCKERRTALKQINSNTPHAVRQQTSDKQKKINKQKQTSNIKVVRPTDLEQVVVKQELEELSKPDATNSKVSGRSQNKFLHKNAPSAGRPIGVAGNEECVTVDAGALSTELTGVELQQVYHRTFSDSLCTLLQLTGLEGIFVGNTEDISNIIHNMTHIGKNGIVTNVDKKDQLPMWLVDAMRCLAYWPDQVVESIPGYSNFARDVFRVISDYFQSLSEPVFPHSLYPTVINIIDTLLQSFDESEVNDALTTDYGIPGHKQSVNCCRSTPFHNACHANQSDEHICMETSFGLNTSSPRTRSVPAEVECRVPACTSPHRAFGEQPQASYTEEVFNNSVLIEWSDVDSVSWDVLPLNVNTRRLSQSCTQLVTDFVTRKPLSATTDSRQLLACKSTSTNDIYFTQSLDDDVDQPVCKSCHRVGKAGVAKNSENSEYICTSNEVLKPVNRSQALDQRRRYEPFVRSSVPSKVRQTSLGMTRHYGVERCASFLRSRSSYRLAVDANFSYSTPPGKSLYSAPEMDVIAEGNDDCETYLVKTLQHICLLLPPSRRRMLQLLLRFLHKIANNERLVLDEVASNRHLVLQTFAKYILAARDSSLTDTRRVLAIVGLMIDQHPETTHVPHQLQTNVDRTISSLLCMKMQQTKKLPGKKEIAANRASDGVKKQHSRTASLLRKPLDRLRSLRL